VKSLIAQTIDKQEYLVKLCRALIRYGAPTHRLEAYMRTSAQSLELGGQFLYIPGCMIISFDDENTHTAEVKLVREDQGVDLGRMDSVHNIYKRVANRDLTVREGTTRLHALMKREPQYSKPWLVLMYGLAAASVGPFAFQARMLDTPIAFILGCLVGLLQYYLNARSELWASCFTIIAAFMTSALARVFGSIHNGEYFCFSALAQSSIALILPGYTVLCAALELQSGAIVAGSIRLVYALIYSLFLGFGITLGKDPIGSLARPSADSHISGSVVVGVAWKDAVSTTHCPHPMENYWFFLSVPVFTLCLIVINQAKWKQAPVQMIISLAGYQTNYWVSQYIKGQNIANACGACVVGLLANMYARFGYAHEQRLVRGSLVSGVTSADQITHNTTGVSVASNATDGSSVQLNSVVLTVGYSVIQIAVAITVGLFVSTVLVYPRGKKK
ncbi:DUF1212-domain-containing protein, partial [Rhizodiscina lignyota]